MEEQEKYLENKRKWSPIGCVNGYAHSPWDLGEAISKHGSYKYAILILIGWLLHLA